MCLTIAPSALFSIFQIFIILLLFISFEAWTLFELVMSRWTSTHINTLNHVDYYWYLCRVHCPCFMVYFWLFFKRINDIIDIVKCTLSIFFLSFSRNFHMKLQVFRWLHFHCWLQVWCFFICLARRTITRCSNQYIVLHILTLPQQRESYTVHKETNFLGTFMNRASWIGNRRVNQSGLIVKPSMLSNRSELAETGKIREPAVYSNRVVQMCVTFSGINVFF
jgi:hypothetical protein